MPLFGDVAGKNVMDLVNDEDPQLNIAQQMDDLHLFSLQRSREAYTELLAIPESRCRIGSHQGWVAPE